MWYRVALAVPQEVADGLTSFLCDEGSIGQEVGDAADDQVTLIAYFRADVALESLRAEIAQYLEALRELGMFSRVPKVRLVRIVGDWLASWRRYFRPIEVTRRLVVRPSWATCSLREGQSEIVIDPQTAFGTGHHETTRICLRAEETVIRQGDKVLDVGTGTGILTVRAVQLGARSVLGIDNDPEAVRVGRRNLAVNGVNGDVQVTCGDVRYLEDSFNVILANIHSGVLTPLLPTFLRLLLEQGRAVLSGITRDEEEGFCSRVSQAGFQIRGVWREGEWVGLEGVKEKG